MFSKLLQAATSSSRWALPSEIQSMPSSSMSTTNSDVAKVLELKDVRAIPEIVKIIS